MLPTLLLLLLLLRLLAPLRMALAGRTVQQSLRGWRVKRSAVLHYRRGRGEERETRIAQSAVALLLERLLLRLLDGTEAIAAGCW